MDQINTQLPLVDLEENQLLRQNQTPPDETVNSEADLKRLESNHKKCQKWRLKNLEKCKQRSREWYRNNKQRAREYRLANWDKELENKRKYRQANPDKLKEENRKAQNRKNEWLRKWRANNPEKNRQYRKNALPSQYARYRNKRNTDPQFAMAERLRGRLGVALSRQLAKKYRSTFSLLGCSIPEFISKIESMFTHGMSWNNRSEWHLDHIVPVKWFDLLNEEEQSACFNWKNFQPLWGRVNFEKKTTVPNPLPSWLPPHIAQRITLRSAQPKCHHS